LLLGSLGQRLDEVGFAEFNVSQQVLDTSDNNIVVETMSIYAWSAQPWQAAN
jgi:hypothetical protein